MKTTAILSLVVTWPLLAGADEEPTARPLDGVDIEEHVGSELPRGLVFRDQSGNPVRLADRMNHGRPLLLVLAWYRCPMLCERVLSGVARALPAGGAWRLGQDYHAVTVSFADQEGPSDADRRRRAHLGALGLPLDSTEWPFLVGDKASIAALTGALGFRFRYDDESGQYAHAAAVFVITPAGRISRYLYGVDYPTRDLRLALSEAGEGRVGPSVDRVLLACYRYNPARRRYGLFLSRFLQVGGLLVFGGLAALMAALWRWEERRAAAARRSTSWCATGESGPSSAPNGW